MNWNEVVKSHEIRKIYQDASLDKIKHLPSPMIEMAKRWIGAKDRPSLYLTGSVGSGKTYFMTALLRALIEKGHTWFRFTRSVDLFDEFYQLAVSGKSSHEKLKIIAEVPLLFIDDVGVESMTERVQKEYFSIIDYRVTEMLPFVFTSNLSKQEFGKLLGERVQSRMHSCLEIEFPTRDLRKELNFYTL